MYENGRIFHEGQDSAGASATDFILLVAVVDSEVCSDVDPVLVNKVCHQDKKTDRLVNENSILLMFHQLWLKCGYLM